MSVMGSCPEPVEGPHSEFVEGLCPELVEGLRPELVEGLMYWFCPWPMSSSNLGRRPGEVLTSRSSSAATTIVSPSLATSICTMEGSFCPNDNNSSTCAQQTTSGLVLHIIVYFC